MSKNPFVGLNGCKGTHFRKTCKAFGAVFLQKQGKAGKMQVDLDVYSIVQQSKCQPAHHAMLSAGTVLRDGDSMRE